MPDVTRPFDRKHAVHEDAEGPVMSGMDHDTARPVGAPPRSAWAAILRGVKGRCPRCEGARLFRKFLKPIDRCPSCGQDWTPQRADDFPAYVSIFVTGHLMAPVIIGLVQETQLPIWALAATVVTMALVLMIAILQPAKGGIIAMQWWFEMHGFRRDKTPDEENRPRPTGD